MKSILISAATSNSGKTTFTMGLLRALKDRGLTVQPYKCGPDYIDTMYHHIASGRESVNLDTFMASKEHVKEVFHKYGKDADCRVIEGVMGLFDGYDKWHGSSGEIALLTSSPVILVVNAKSMAYSVAALLYGFKHFNPQIRIAGVVFNMVASENHFSYLRSACEDAGVECLGYLPRNKDLVIPERHLGLTIAAREEMEKLICLSAEEIEKHVDIDRLLSLCNMPSVDNMYEDGSVGVCEEGDTTKCEGGEVSGMTECKAGKGEKVIAVAHDEAFNFTYRANIDALREQGEVVFFSPIHDSVLPACNMLYLPGGYPELFAEELTANATMRESIRNYIENGGMALAECGGFMYLCRDIDGSEMCGILPIHATMDNAHLHLGYRKTEGLRGHEFHYSSVVESELPAGITVERKQQSAKGMAVTTPIYRYKNLTAGYTHWYWAEEAYFFTASGR